MTWNTTILRKEGDIFKKIQAFRLFKEWGIEYIDENYPKLHSFVLENKHKSIEELENELLANLKQFKNEVA